MTNTGLLRTEAAEDSFANMERLRAIHPVRRINE